MKTKFKSGCRKLTPLPHLPSSTLVASRGNAANKNINLKLEPRKKKKVRKLSSWPNDDIFMQSTLRQKVRS